MTTTQASPPAPGSAAARPTPSPPALAPTSYPHIWDQILFYADQATFSALRATCSTLYGEVAARLYNHVEVHLTKQTDRLHIDLCAPYTHRRLPGLDFATNPVLCLDRLYLFCTSLDEVVHGVPVLHDVCDAALDTFGALERALENVTVHRVNAEYYWSLFSLPQVRKVVAFLHPKPDPYAGYESEEDDFPDPLAMPLFLATPGPSVRGVIINVTIGATGFRADSLQHMANLERIGIIVHKGDAPPPAPLRWCAGLSGLFTSLAPLFPRVKVVISGLEALPDKWLSTNVVPTGASERRHHLCKEIALWIRCCQVLSAGKGTEWAASLEKGDGDEVIGIGPIMESISVKSLEQMRESIGDGAFDMFMIPPAAWCVQVNAGNGAGQ
ncbi:uncharacterized protein LOC62_07G008893 [Vanrija pseudolonga]|uniref:Uncharacterized protein n=1 Tax=Vanrija pseudolonga TaxID=143232 RepID=A0AAF1BR03_9TREE|nr:hypothetical protein LOC62_07G008893 [Vanrija pseudolonga]